MISFAKKLFGDLSAAGYDAQWIVLPADAAGAPQKRARWFCRCVLRRPNASTKITQFESTTEIPRPSKKWAFNPRPSPSMWLQATTDHRTKRQLEMLGNAVVPQRVELAARLLDVGRPVRAEGASLQLVQTYSYRIGTRVDYKS